MIARNRLRKPFEQPRESLAHPHRRNSVERIQPARRKEHYAVAAHERGIAVNLAARNKKIGNGELALVAVCAKPRYAVIAKKINVAAERNRFVELAAVALEFYKSALVKLGVPVGGV